MSQIIDFSGKLNRRAHSDAFYRSDAWLRLRYEALRRNDGRCEACGASKADGVLLHVDHIMPRSKFPDLELALDNLQVLCEDCNVGKSNRDTTDWRPRRHECERCGNRYRKRPYGSVRFCARCHPNDLSLGQIIADQIEAAKRIAEHDKEKQP